MVKKMKSTSMSLHTFAPLAVSRSSRSFVFAALFSLTACGGASDPSVPKVQAASTSGQLSEDLVLEDFDKMAIPATVKVNNGAVSLVDSARGDKALLVKLDLKENNSAALVIAPEEPWDWSEFSDFNLAFDVANKGTESVQIDVTMTDKNGDSYTRGMVVPADGVWRTYYAKLHGHDQQDPDSAAKNEFNFSSGLRSNPPTWQSDDVMLHSFWGKKLLDLSGITKISFGSDGSLSNRQYTIDNIRLRANPEMDKNFLTGLLDKYGQNAKVDYEGKIHSDEELRAVVAEELAGLSGKLNEGRSKYSGWKDGPRFKSTGYFRTQKVNGKWALIDPEGYLYFSTGIDIIRLSNSSTITGYDYDQALIPARSDDEVIAEDDQPLNRVNEKAWATRHLVSETRAKMFTWLPDYNDPLGNHYGYRRETQSGPLKHGETFSFYSANLERRYGESYPESYLDTWRKVTVDRMLDWGFTSLGNWADASFYQEERIPFVAFADIIGDFGTLSSGFDFWHPVPDPFDPRFYQRALVAAESVNQQINGSPWCMGVFFDNEQSFGRLESDELHYGIVINALSRDAADTPAKSAFTEILKKKYGSIEALNKAWNKQVASWEAFAAGMDSSISTDAQLEDYASLLFAYGDQYFGTINRAMKSIMPNHLYLGSRLPSWGMPDEIVKAAAKNVDIISYNLYEEGLVPSKWEFLAEIDKPSLIGEFSFGADDQGHFHPGIVISADQKDRGRMFRNYMYSFIDNPYFVGVHMFQYMDSPITGRAYDGENYANGFVSVTDVPYIELVKAAKEVNGSLYKRRYGDVQLRARSASERGSD
ncbi:agarase [Microbulbifer thermotolerans]|uniref:agarase n=1 Tax=Microbulbifer thermotolerans TaxID=252514 RepID=UPI00224B970C|nr:agarase [Microbulbifer thermotolerans]MCX2835819.1 agarase [Microbulbifer thermotolerans]